jgi:tRNA-uridine 2-sulfurtransferase
LAAALLVDRGYRVIGATMKTFCYAETPTHGRTCCGLDGIMDARRVCERLGVPHYVFDMEDSFGTAVMDDFVSEYVAGRTPNPCVRCNSNTKIPDLLRRGRMLGADRIATGHYARMLNNGGGPRIGLSSDEAKDQTYFLWGIPQDVLPYLMFPVGDLTKPEVRERARGLGLATADKPESQEICFVPTGDYTDFLADRLGTAHPALSEGELVTRDGKVVGHHDGYGRYTVGQRKGLGGGHGRRLYVLGVVPGENHVVVGSDDELFRDVVVLGDVNWLAAAPEADATVRVRLRHRAPLVEATVEARADDTIRLRLSAAQRAVTPGQSGAVYDGDVLLGGGRIR